MVQRPRGLEGPVVFVDDETDRAPWLGVEGLEDVVAVSDGLCQL